MDSFYKKSNANESAPKKDDKLQIIMDNTAKTLHNSTTL